jgi:uncharacterized membrane protein
MVTLGKSRIEALSDGVFAIAMTLLVLKLEVPEHQHSNEEMLAQILALRPQFLTYVVTFLIAGGFWFLHHLTFHFIRHVNAFLVWVNLLYLMFVSLLPFSAGLMGHLQKHPVSQLFYFGNMLAIALLLNLHWHYARRKDFIVDTDPEEATRIGYRLGLTAVAFSICMVSAVLSPEYSWVPLWLFVFGFLIERVRRRRKR